MDLTCEGTEGRNGDTKKRAGAREISICLNLRRLLGVKAVLLHLIHENICV